MKVDISSLPEDVQVEICKIADRPKRVVDISNLDAEMLDNINHIVYADAIQIVRQGLRERKRV